MAHKTFASWAEIDPNHGPMTADEFLVMPDENGWQHELVEGVVVKMPSPGFQHGVIEMELAHVLANYVQERNLGVVTGAETGFLLSQVGQKDTVLGADVAFVRSEHVPPPNTPGIEKYLRVAPDVAAEVASPDQYRPEMAAKARVYLDAGVRLVWIVWPYPPFSSEQAAFRAEPASQTVDVWRPGSDAPTTLAIADTLDGYDVVPGFTCPVADLFA
ncbi:MAG: Uma2 family endonuclease [Ktedonobacterales bacterium]